MAIFWYRTGLYKRLDSYQHITLVSMLLHAFHYYHFAAAPSLNISRLFAGSYCRSNPHTPYDSNMSFAHVGRWL